MRQNGAMFMEKAKGRRTMNCADVTDPEDACEEWEERKENET